MKIASNYAAPRYIFISASTRAAAPPSFRMLAGKKEPRRVRNRIVLYFPSFHELAWISFRDSRRCSLRSLWYFTVAAGEGTFFEGFKRIAGNLASITFFANLRFAPTCVLEFQSVGLLPLGNSRWDYKTLPFHLSRINLYLHTVPLRF